MGHLDAVPEIPCASQGPTHVQQCMKMIDAMQITVARLQQQLQHQAIEIDILRTAVRKATAAPIWVAPNKDEDM